MRAFLEPTIYTDEYSYFFVLLGPRFDATISFFTQSLEKTMGGIWKPIFIYSSKPADAFQKDNFIIMNRAGDEIELTVGESVVALQEYEELNEEFVSSPEVQSLFERLLKKQQKIVIVPFTTSFLEIENPNIIVIGPESSIAKRFDNKISQYNLFRELNLPRNQATIFSNQNDLLAAGTNILPCYITAAYSSGGSESGLVFSQKMLKKFFSRLRDVNATGSFLIAEIFEGLTLAPNVNALITASGKVELLIITDQVLRGNRYLGNVFPSKISMKHQAEIVLITKQVGEFLAKQKYRGLFGLDFLINNKGDLVVVDLNPRRQGGYACNVLALKSIGIDLVEAEIRTHLGENLTLSLPDHGATFPYAWAHSKIKPSDPGQRVTIEKQSGDLVQAFMSSPGIFEATFYEKGSIFIDGYTGYLAVTGSDRNIVVKELSNRAEHLLSETLL